MTAGCWRVDWLANVPRAMLKDLLVPEPGMLHRYRTALLR
jgi:hypothetical protein